VTVQEDLPEGWTISSTLTMIGLGSIAPGAKTAPPTIDLETAKEMFAKLYFHSAPSPKPQAKC